MSKASTNEQETAKIDDIFDKIGEFGSYQFFVLFLIGLTAMIPATLAYSYIFIGATPDFRCRIPNYENDTFEIQNHNHQALIDLNIPLDRDGVYEKCLLKNINGTYKCNEWVFSKKYYEKTLVTDWNLVCDNVSKKSTFSTVYFAGTYGVILSGILSDKLGRKLSAYTLIVFNAIFNILTAIILNIPQTQLTLTIYGVLRFLTGLTVNLYVIAIVIAVEITGPTKRVFAANFVYYFYIIGEYFTCLISYFIRDYTKLYIFLSGYISCYVLYFWIVPESPRWLFAKQRIDKALVILKRIAKSNNKTIPEFFENFLLETFDNSNKNISSKTKLVNVSAQLGFFEAFKVILTTRVLLIRTLVIIFNWLTNNLVYYGLTLGTGDLKWGSPYLNFALSTTVELIAIICSHYCFNKFGRKIPYLICMFLAGLSLIAVIFVPNNHPELITVIALIGKFSISLTYNGIYIITTETYPTFIRNTAVSVSQFITRFGAVTAPYINLLSEVYWYPSTFLIYGIFSLVASLLTIFFIKETRDLKLPETLDELKDSNTSSVNNTKL